MKPPLSLAIGNFDGVHLGHRALIDRTIAFAREQSLTAAVLTFDPHPTVVVAPTRVPAMLISLEERLQLLHRAGIEHVEVLSFDRDTAALSPRGFVSQILVERLNTKAVFVGENFRFGFRKGGTPEVLRELGRELGFEPHFLPPVMLRGEIVSSSAIRQHLTDGRINRANHLLGRCFSLSGPVVSGHGVGSKQTVPTLNLVPSSGQLVPRGVFVTETVDTQDGRRWQSITNAGTRPTFNGEDLTVETFLLTPFEPPTPAGIRVEFRRFLRCERQFPDPAALRDQIMDDIARANSYWRRWSRFSGRVRETAASVY